MNWLTSLYPEIRSTVEQVLPDSWPELQTLFEGLFDNPPPLLSVAILPIACCRAVGGEARAAVPVSAALIAAEVGLRIADDLEDKDRPGQLWQQLGEGRAWNYASAMQALAFRLLGQADTSPPVFRALNQVFSEAFVEVALGQERDLLGPPQTAEDYWRMIELKTGTAYAAACRAGALIGTSDPALIQACRAFGHHTGLAIQIFNDFESIWLPSGRSDLEQGKLTLPLLYGLSYAHPERPTLEALVQSGGLAASAQTVKQILDGIDAKGFMVWAALKEREAALAAADLCPDPEGRAALGAYITGMFGDLDMILAETSAG
jgi:geranylgeranyl pyrophosphate synthase